MIKTTESGEQLYCIAANCRAHKCPYNQCHIDWHKKDQQIRLEKLNKTNECYKKHAN